MIFILFACVDLNHHVLDKVTSKLRYSLTDLMGEISKEKEKAKWLGEFQSKSYLGVDAQLSPAG